MVKEKYDVCFFLEKDMKVFDLRLEKNVIILREIYELKGNEYFVINWVVMIMVFGMMF